MNVLNTTFWSAGSYPQFVGIGARHLRRFTVAPLTAIAEFKPRRLIHTEGRAPTNRQLLDASVGHGSRTEASSRMVARDVAAEGPRRNSCSRLSPTLGLAATILEFTLDDPRGNATGVQERRPPIFVTQTALSAVSPTASRRGGRWSETGESQREGKLIRRASSPRPSPPC